MMNYKFYHMNNISIVGIGSADEASDIVNSSKEVPVVVQCIGVGNSNSAGLTFVHSSNIVIRGVALVGCGVYHNSTSKNYTNIDNFEFLKFYTALFFMFCQTVTMDSVHVNYTQGVGVVMYSTVGINRIIRSVFSNNIIHSPDLPGGGGLYIEFSYCVPDVIAGDYVDCSQGSNVPPTTGAQYTIDNCAFQENEATLPFTMANYAKFILPHREQHVAFGRGGGLSIYFKGNCSNNTISVSNHSLFKSNVALWGGGIFVEHHDNSYYNTFNMSSTEVIMNTCYNKTSEVAGTGGGGVYVGYSFFTQTSDVHHNTMHFENVTFTQNQAYFGGGLTFYSVREQNQVYSTNTLSFESCLWKENIARIGSAIDISPRTTNSTDGALVQPTFKRCTFEGNSAEYANMTGSFVGVGAVYVDSVPIHVSKGIVFQSNRQTALASINAGVYFEEGCQAVFRNNSGRNGGAIALFGNSFIQVSENTTMTFLSNHAERKGGAIYGQSIGEHDLISSRNCFIRYSDITKTGADLNSTFWFKDNTVGDHDSLNLNSLHLTSLLTCIWVSAGQNLQTDRLETISELAKNVFCPQNNSNWHYSDSSADCTHEIATSPAYFYVNDSSISKPFQALYNMSIIPGKQQRIPIRTADDRAHDVTSQMVLTAAIVNHTGAYNVSLDNSSSYVHSNDSIIVYGEPYSEALIKFEMDLHRVIATTVNVTLMPCPPGLTIAADSHGNAKCHCSGDYIYSGYVECDTSAFLASLQMGGWIGKYDGALVAGQCPYKYCKSFEHEINLTTDEDLNTVCTENREGTLCGKCKTSASAAPAVNTDDFKCVHCSSKEEKYNWVIYLVAEYLPITVFFFIVVLFNVSITSGPANAFVYFAQIITSTFKLQADGSIPLQTFDVRLQKSYTIPYDIWNLNFFRSVLPPFCISRKITMLQYISSAYITAFYPFLLVTVFYTIVSLYAHGIQPFVCLFKPIHRCFSKFRSIWNIERSVLHSLAAFLLLSYTKFTLVSFNLLKSSPLVNAAGEVQVTVVYYDGSVEYLSKRHTPYIIISVLVLIVFVLLPPIILIMPSVSHGLQKLVRRYTKREADFLSCYPGPSWQHFLNAFHGCYKDGTDDQNETPRNSSNKTDLRWFAGAYFLLRLVSFAIYAFATDWFLQMMMQQIVYVVSLLGFAILRPYKNNFYNNVDVAVFANLITINTLLMYNYHMADLFSQFFTWVVAIQYILIICPLIYILLYSIIYLTKRHGEKVIVCLKKAWPTRMCFHKEVEHDNEDTETFLQFAEESGRLDGVLEYSIDIQDARRRQSPLLVNAQENQALLDKVQNKGAQGSSRQSSNSQRYGSTS